MSYRISDHVHSILHPEPTKEYPPSPGDFFTKDDCPHDSLFQLTCCDRGDYHFTDVSSGRSNGWTYDKLCNSNWAGWTRVKVGAVLSIRVVSGQGHCGGGLPVFDQGEGSNNGKA
jgi:hypothetical protein